MAAEPAIPTIDMSPLRTGSEAEKRAVARRIDEACRSTGFFLVTGHGVSADLITKARQRAIDFFAMPLDEKMKVQDIAEMVAETLPDIVKARATTAPPQEPTEFMSDSADA